MRSKESKEIRKHYGRIWHATNDRMKRNQRASGLKCPNSPERLEEVKRKYQNGIPEGEIDGMIDKIMHCIRM